MDDRTCLCDCDACVCEELPPVKEAVFIPQMEGTLQDLKRLRQRQYDVSEIEFVD